MTKEPTDDEVRALYQESADRYASMMDAEIELPVYDRMLGWLSSAIADVERPVVDTSCGTGHMLERYRERHDSGRPLVGIDLSPEMAARASERLGEAASVVEGDMRTPTAVADGSAAAVINFYALHHLPPEQLEGAFAAWRRILKPGGSLIAATWEGEGLVDYGEHPDLVAYRYSLEAVSDALAAAGFVAERAEVEPVDGFDMDAIYVEARVPS